MFILTWDSMVTDSLLSLLGVRGTAGVGPCSWKLRPTKACFRVTESIQEAAGSLNVSHPDDCSGFIHHRLVVFKVYSSCVLALSAVLYGNIHFDVNAVRAISPALAHTHFTCRGVGDALMCCSHYSDTVSKQCRG